MATFPLPSPPGRRPELQDALNLYLYHPLARRVAGLLLPTGISPNAVSIAGGAMIWIAALFYAGLGLPQSALAGLLFHMLWHVLDGADGDLARMSGRSSPHGEMIDGLCDYAGHSLLYVLLVTMVDDLIGLWAWPLGIAAAVSHALQTNHAETQRRSYLYWVYDRPWIKHAEATGHAVFRKSGAGTWLTRAYLRAANAMTPFAALIDAAIEASAVDPAKRARIARLVRRAWRPLFPFHKIVGANPRTLILGLCMVAGSPLAFFLVETILLNLVLLVSLVRHRRAGARLAARLGA
jgi:phosphatidylglycerophosphate synthase